MSRLFQLRARKAPLVPPRLAETARAGLGSGTKLDAFVHSKMEQRLGQAIPDVRIHDDAAAHASARALGSQAFTIGTNVVFSRGRFDPHNPSGQALLSHELAHAVQQSGRGRNSASPTELEQEAESVAAGVQSPNRPKFSCGEVGVQRRVEIRDVGKGEQSGFARVGELIERLNRISTALIFSVESDGALTYTENPYGDVTEFDRQMKAFIDGSKVLPMRMTNRHGLVRHAETGPYNLNVTFDSYRTGYVDIDDLLAVDDLDLQTSLVHILRERQVTFDYARRIGTAGLDPTLSPRARREFESSHRQGVNAELAVLRDYFQDPGLRPLDADQRIFRTGRGDTLRERSTPGRGRAGAGISIDAWEVTLRGSGRRMSGPDYRALLERERSAAGGGGTP